MRIASALFFAAGIALAAYRLRALSRGGALAASIVGTAVFSGGGFRYASVMLSFFVSSSVLSRLRERHAPRSASQVAANGACAALCAVLACNGRSPALEAAFAGACAAAAADTWGTELGMLAGGRPRSILSFQAIERGLSGGVTVAGLSAQAAGALWVAWVADRMGVAECKRVACAGFFGALVDSLLGAGLQELRFCDRCNRNTESNPHRCGSATRLVRGFPWLRNDQVNALATIVGALAAGSLTL